jgi:hypothetical protein
MPTVAKPNESVSLPFFKNGVTLDFYTIDLQTSGAALITGTSYATYNGGEITSAGVERSPVVVALEAIQAKTSVEIIGNAVTGNASNSAFRVGIASLGGVYPTDDYASYGTPGSGESFAAYLQALIRAQVNTDPSAAGYNTNTFQGVDLSAATVTRFVI